MIFAAFLFNADHSDFEKHGVYGAPCEEAFLQALAIGDKEQEFNARIRRGDVLAHSLASKLQRLTITPEAERNGPIDPSLSRQFGTNQRSLAIITGDVADSIKALWSSVNLAELPCRLSMTNVYCLSAFPINLPLIKRIDVELKKYPPYIGAVELDPGNPIHTRLFSHLLDCVSFSGNKMYISRWDTDEGAYEFGINPANKFNVIELPDEIFEQTAPAFPSVTSFSERGDLSANRLKEVAELCHFEKIAEQLADPTFTKKIDRTVDLKILLPSDEEIHIPTDKLLKYCLNLEHKEGQHKALLFHQLLDINKSNWRYLAYQIVDGLSRCSKFHNVQVNEHGVKYTAHLQIIGINQKNYTIETGWIIRKKGAAQLVTAYPADKRKQRPVVGAMPPWVPEEIQGSNRWEAIYAAANKCGREAAATCVPTPMLLKGYEIEMEGMCGGALVRLDGRSRFSRWLVEQGHVHRGSGSGVYITANIGSQSVDRAKAYARAFSRVCLLNGIEKVEVEVYLS